MDLSQPVILIGAACLLASFIAYLRDTAKAVFPIVLALVGVFLCGAQVVKATLPGGGSIELSQQVIATTKEASATVDASTDALTKQGAVLQALGTRIDTLQSALQTLQNELNSRLAQTDTPPVALPQTQALDASSANVSAALKESMAAHQKLILQGNALRTAVKALPNAP